MNSENLLKQLLKNIYQRLNDILEYYQNFKNLKADKYFKQHSIFISLTLLEIEIIKKYLDFNEHEKIIFPQYSFTFKKIHTFRVNSEKIDKNKVSDYIKKIEQIQDELENLIGVGTICDNLDMSVIDDLSDPNSYPDYLENIIKNAYDLNFHKFYLNYIHEFIKQKANNNNIYTKENLTNLKIVKYITQILIFIKLYILNDIENINSLEEEESNEKILKEDKNMIYFSLYLVRNSNGLEHSPLLKDNEKTLKELIYIYKVILNIIEKFKSIKL